MVIAHHLIWTVYGTWLPNDPRGSGSVAVIDPNIAALGELHFGRRKIQPAAKVIHQFYEGAESELKYPVRRFDPDGFSLVADAIGGAIAKRGYTCYAAAMMPDHIHLVIRKHRDLAETDDRRVAEPLARAVVRGRASRLDDRRLEAVSEFARTDSQRDWICREKPTRNPSTAAIVGVRQAIRRLAFSQARKVLNRKRR